MLINVNVPDSPVVTVAGMELEVDLSRFTQPILDHIFAYGLKQKLNDGAALPKGSSWEDKFSAAEKRLAGLYEGKLRKDRAVTTKATPIDKIMRRLATDDLRIKVGRFTGKGEWKADDKQRERMRAACAKYELDFSDTEGAFDALVDIRMENFRVEAEAEHARNLKLIQAASEEI